MTTMSCAWGFSGKEALWQLITPSGLAAWWDARDYRQYDKDKIVGKIPCPRSEMMTRVRTRCLWGSWIRSWPQTAGSRRSWSTLATATLWSQSCKCDLLKKKHAFDLLWYSTEGFLNCPFYVMIVMLTLQRHKTMRLLLLNLCIKWIEIFTCQSICRHV